MRRITTQDVQSLLWKPGVQVIDARPVEAYNGWAVNGAPRGGHLPGARSLPAKWLDYIDWPEIVTGKGIAPQQDILVYGDDEARTAAVARQFDRAGYGSVTVYHGLVDEWLPNEGLPLDRMTRYRHLVSAEWLHRLLTTGQAPEWENGRFVLCHAFYQRRSAYDEGHIPGAVDLDTNTLEAPETWNRRPPSELKRTLEGLGIRHDTTVILYGRFAFPDNRDPFPGASAGHLAALRCAFLMMVAGVEDVRVLNGGLRSWLDAGYGTTTEPTAKRPVADFGARIPGRPEWVIDTPQAKTVLATEGQNLVSVRSWDEFIGKVSGYHYIERKGRIPGAVFADCGSDAYHMENYRNLDHTTREYGEIARLWAGAGITRETFNAFYCGTGWRASEAFFNAWLMGWNRIAVYDGGWFEWSGDPRNPVATGEPTP